MAENVIVMRGNLVSDVQLEAVVASHRLRNATATVMLARPRDELVNLTSGKKGAKTVVQKPSKSKAPKTFVGLGEGGCAGEGGRLCLWVSEASLNGGEHASQYLRTGYGEFSRTQSGGAGSPCRACPCPCAGERGCPAHAAR